MKQSWIELTITCPDCKVEITINQIAYSADGEWRFSGLCPKCHRKVWVRNYATVFAYKALCKDLERVEKPKPIVPGSPLKPPLALPRVPETLSDEDKAWMKEMHLDPEKGDLE
jgi:hypothetical protein